MTLKFAQIVRVYETAKSKGVVERLRTDLQGIFGEAGRCVVGPIRGARQLQATKNEIVVFGDLPTQEILDAAFHTQARLYTYTGFLKYMRRWVAEQEE